MNKKTQSKFTKFSADKLNYDLIPPETLESLAEILTYGAKKYEPNNWKNCKDISVYISSLFRHLQEYRKGRIADTESGLSHVKHLLVNAAFICYLVTKQEENICRIKKNVGLAESFGLEKDFNFDDADNVKDFNFDDADNVKDFNFDDSDNEKD